MMNGPQDTPDKEHNSFLPYYIANTQHTVGNPVQKLHHAMEHRANQSKKSVDASIRAKLMVATVYVHMCIVCVHGLLSLSYICALAVRGTCDLNTPESVYSCMCASRDILFEEREFQTP